MAAQTKPSTPRGLDMPGRPEAQQSSSRSRTVGTGWPELGAGDRPVAAAQVPTGVADEVPAETRADRGTRAHTGPHGAGRPPAVVRTMTVLAGPSLAIPIIPVGGPFRPPSVRWRI
jgi:hypothetical protein